MITVSPRNRRLRALGVALVFSVLIAACVPASRAAEPPSRVSCGGSDKPFGIGTLSVSIPVGAGRSLVTTIAYPSLKGTSGAGARPACGQFPMIVVAHGSQGTGASAVDLHTYLVRQGYVLVAPTFGGGFDLTQNARDVRKVITAVLRRDRRGDLPFSGNLRRGKIGFIGTSLGGMTGLSLYRDCCVDDRIDAVIPKLASAIGSGYRWRAGPPLLMINGTADSVVSYEDAVATYEDAKHVKGLITLHGIGHDLLLGTDPILQESSLAFFGRYLKGKPGGLKGVVRAAKDSEIATLRKSW